MSDRMSDLDTGEVDRSTVAATAPANEATSTRERVVVVGAGVAGLTAAQALSLTFDVVVLDKARGVGGRLATRRIGDATLDHGAQFITTHSSEFAKTMVDWERAGVARPWFRGRIGPEGIVDPDGHTRFRGVGTMNAIAKHLAAGLDVRLSIRVAALAPSGIGWRIELEDGPDLQADGVVLTAPVPQALALLNAGSAVLSGTDAHALQAISYEPCLAVLVPLDGPSGLDDPGAVAPSSGPIGWMADNRAKGVSAASAVTIHATAEFSATHFESSDEFVVAEMLQAANLRGQPISDRVQVQRWLFARPTTIHPSPYLIAEGLPPLVFAGDAFGSAKVEGASLSGSAAAHGLTTLIGRTEASSPMSGSADDR